MVVFLFLVWQPDHPRRADCNPVSHIPPSAIPQGALCFWHENDNVHQVENTTAPKRDAHGRLLPGQSGNPRGRPALPDWFKDAAPAALQHLVNVATGVEDVEPELRLKAATLVVERFYGKSPETVTLEGELAISRIVRTIVDPKSDG